MKQGTSKEENIWGKPKRTLKFVWRHFFTLIDLSLSISVLVNHTLLWKNALISLSIAITVDWAKQYIKLTPRCHTHNAFQHTSIQPFRDQWWDSSLRGTPAHFLNNMDNNRYN